MLDEILKDAEGTGPMRGGNFLPYVDCCGKSFRECQCVQRGLRKAPGKLTFGWGYNVEDLGVPPDIAELLFQREKQKALDDLRENFPWWNDIDQVRKDAFADMRYNLGYDGFREWKQTLSYAERGDWKGCARQFKSNRKYFEQTKTRAERIAREIETGIAG